MYVLYVRIFFISTPDNVLCQDQNDETISINHFILIITQKPARLLF